MQTTVNRSTSMLSFTHALFNFQLMSKLKNSYSLWLRPTQEQTDDLTKIISKLAHRYRTIPFPPHITLLSGIPTDLETINKTWKKISEQHQGFDIALEEVAYTDLYFKNLFIHARTEKQLKKLYEDVSNRFKRSIHEEYSPHVSLLYGKLALKTQQGLKKELDGNYPKKFSCQRLDIYNITNKESEWHLIESYTLSRP